MSIGPLRRLVGAVGLVGLVPLLGMLAAGVLSPQDAAFRALVMVGCLLVLGRFVSWGVSILATQVERADQEAGAETPEHHPAT